MLDPRPGVVLTTLDMQLRKAQEHRKTSALPDRRSAPPLLKF